MSLCPGSTPSRYSGSPHRLGMVVATSAGYGRTAGREVTGGTERYQDSVSTPPYTD